MLVQTARRCHFGSQPFTPPESRVFLPPPTPEDLSCGAQSQERQTTDSGHPKLLSSSGQNMFRVCGLKEGRSFPTDYQPSWSKRERSTAGSPPVTSSFSSSFFSFSFSSCDDVCSVFCAGPPLPSCVFSVACRTSTAIMCGQCCVLDLNRDAVRPVLRAGPQPRSCEASVACRTSTAMLCGQCCAPDINRDQVSSVWRAGPHPRNVSERRMSERL